MACVLDDQRPILVGRGDLELSGLEVGSGNGGIAMKRSMFSEAQIAFAVRQAEEGTAIDEVRRKVGIREATFYVWLSEIPGPAQSNSA